MRPFSSLFKLPSPERIAAKELQSMRLILFQAERRLLDAQMRVNYYREMVDFLADVQASGLEHVIDKRRVPASDDFAQASRIFSDITTVPMAPFAT
ncbi:hypothetical protein P3W85_23480 [Cupriavidus basilensis]|uniref:Uncharacterized protein n=1 Tax=Cupriavidus basilensis TaxID=68895 RepID=A0ABT6AUE4_9BURK|nr:hypothetical protein [Cupriavidus basilensis]MDF3835887.1 hypothetical protein [Cupriavidus basilensis]